MNKLVFLLDQRALNVIGSALGSLPYREAAPVVADLNAQLAAHAAADAAKAAGVDIALPATPATPAPAAATPATEAPAPATPAATA